LNSSKRKLVLISHFSSISEHLLRPHAKKKTQPKNQSKNKNKQTDFKKRDQNKNKNKQPKKTHPQSI
jgi:hypothetical protein